MMQDSLNITSDAGLIQLAKDVVACEDQAFKSLVSPDASDQERGRCKQCSRKPPLLSINLEYTTSVTSYIGKCIDDVTISKTITSPRSQKPWMTAKVHALLKSRDSDFRAGDKMALKTARAKLYRAIREAKPGESTCPENGDFKDSGDYRCMWQGIQAITNYKTTSPACDGDASLSDALNDFYAWFEAQNSVAVRKTIPPPNNQVLCFSTAVVKNWQSAQEMCRTASRCLY
ncbi:hypothetical protein QTP70_024816 [Hemibagrus guttatus]|uniref:Uncharacterized protein n=1 Tax=Hemibagrus guttatus TaxID=175788 RepID=A0AAE0Q377_9TELE|nr:hypothetical protein QTP70_024816 [Hemibagrus guttatus]